MSARTEGLHFHDIVVHTDGVVPELASKVFIDGVEQTVLEGATVTARFSNQDLTVVTIEFPAGSFRVVSEAVTS